MTSSFFGAPYHPLRPYLLSRASYLLLAGDLWFGMVQHGGRYGLGGFNVAHFAVLDVFMPVRSPLPYVALLLCSGFLSLSLALFSQPAWLRWMLAATYTLAWMISLHDSYQHHYFVSWLLAWLAAMPELTLRDLDGTAEQRVRGWGFPMTCMTCAIVYAFTGIAKSEATWRRGDVLRVLAQHGAASSDWTQPFAEALGGLGVSETALWTAFAYATIALQWTIALGYLAAAGRDAQPARWRTILASLGLLGALSFHVSAEWFGHFEIGVFSYYMMGLALTVLTPLAFLTFVGRGLTFVRRRTSSLFAQAQGAESWPRLLLLVGVLSAVGSASPLPGAQLATLLLAALTGLRFVHAYRHRPETLRPLAAQTVFCALALLLALTQSSMTFDYYRRTAGELRNMGQLAAALDAYRMAERHAPRGRSRAQEIQALERALAPRK